MLAPGGPPATADPTDVAAVLWLRRPEGWETAYAAAVVRVEQAGEAADARRAEQRREGAEARLREAEEALREERRRHRAEVAALREELTTLRRRLGEARASAREAGSARAEAEARRDAAQQDARAEAAEGVRAAEKEVRRLRGRVDELQAAAATGAGRAREDREAASARARLLLDTVLEAATGLRRELALPPAEASPGERAEAAVAARGDGDGPAGPVGDAPTPVSPGLLEELLARPRSRLLVDGYNVTKSGWPDATLEAQRSRLLTALAPLATRTGAETTVVFDAGATTHRPVVPAPRGVRVAWSPPGVIADDVLRELVAAEPEGRTVVVVTSDQAVQRDVARAGARAVASEVLVALLR